MARHRSRDRDALVLAVLALCPWADPQQPPLRLERALQPVGGAWPSRPGGLIAQQLRRAHLIEVAEPVRRGRPPLNTLAPPGSTTMSPRRRVGSFRILEIGSLPGSRGMILIGFGLWVYPRWLELCLPVLRGKGQARVAHAKGHRTRQSHLAYTVSGRRAQDVTTLRDKHGLGTAWLRQVPAPGDDERLDVAGLGRWREQCEKKSLRPPWACAAPLWAAQATPSSPSAKSGRTALARDLIVQLLHPQQAPSGHQRTSYGLGSVSDPGQRYGLPRPCTGQRCADPCPALDASSDQFGPLDIVRGGGGGTALKEDSCGSPNSRSLLVRWRSRAGPCWLRPPPRPRSGEQHGRWLQLAGLIVLLAVIGAAAWYFGYARNRAHTSSSLGVDRDRVAGSAEQAKGSVKESVGNVLGDSKLQAEGRADQVEGKAQNTAGGIKDTLRGQ